MFTPTPTADKGDATNTIGRENRVCSRGNSFALVLVADTIDTLLVAVCRQGHKEQGTCIVSGREARQRVALVNKPVAPTIATVAVEVVEGPVLFLKIPVARSAAKVREEEEGKRGGRDGKAVVGWQWMARHLLTRRYCQTFLPQTDTC